jgi:hypothetical protein
MWVIVDTDSVILAEFVTSREAYEATYTGDYPDNVEVAYINE